MKRYDGKCWSCGAPIRAGKSRRVKVTVTIAGHDIVQTYLTHPGDCHAWCVQETTKQGRLWADA